MMYVANFVFKPYLEPGEEIYAVFHRHPFVVLPDVARITLFGYLVPTFLWFMFPEFVLFFILWLGFSTVRALYLILAWYHDVLLITNVSLLDIEWEGFFDRTSARLEYPMIEGIACEIRGLTQTLFNFGLVSINRAGGGAALELKDAINPRKVERKIMMHQDKFVTHQNLKDADALKGLLTTMLRHQAKTQGIPEQGE